MYICPTNGDDWSQSAEFGDWKERLKRKTINLLSESWSIPDSALMEEDVARWCYFLGWSREYVIPESGTPYHTL
jgi:hypothetical protein